MCSARRSRSVTQSMHVALGAAALLTSIALPASAQSAVELRAAVERDVAAYESAARDAGPSHSARRARPLLQGDTVRAGRVSLFAHPEFTAVARAAVELTLQNLDRMPGGAGRNAAPVFSLSRDSIRVPTRRGNAAANRRWRHRTMLVLHSDSGAERVLSFQRMPEAEPLAEAMTAGVARSTIASLDAAARNFTLAESVAPAGDRALFALAWTELVTATSRAARDCLEDRRARCYDALGVTATANPLALWYDERDYYSLAVDELRRSRQVAPDSMLVRCERTAEAAACAAFARGVEPADVPPPLGGASRGAAMRLALLLGGEGAFERLRQSSDRSMPERVEFVSQVPAESLGGRWLAAARAQRPKPVTVPARAALTAVGWGAVLALLSMRSSRWRAR